MACPVCGANCVCQRRGPGGLCCGCHKHKAQRGMSRARLDAWRHQHALPPVSDARWKRQYDKHVEPNLPDMIDTREEARGER